MVLPFIHHSQLFKHHPWYLQCPTCSTDMTSTTEVWGLTLDRYDQVVASSQRSINSVLKHNYRLQMWKAKIGKAFPPLSALSHLLRFRTPLLEIYYQAKIRAHSIESFEIFNIKIFTINSEFALTMHLLALREIRFFNLSESRVKKTISRLLMF